MTNEQTISRSSTHIILNPSELPEPVGYSHAVVVEPQLRKIVIAGQIGADGEGRITAPGNLVEQFDQTLGNIAKVLGAAGASMSSVVRMRIYTTNIGEYRNSLSELGRVWRGHFGRYYPAMTLVGVSELFDPEALIEIDAESYLK